MRAFFDRLKLVPLLMVIALILIIGGKLLFNSNDQNAFLYWYGIIVTSSILLVFLIRYFFYRDPYERAEKILRTKPYSEHPHVSIMVAAYNEEAMIERCVESLVAQTYPNREIIVVNDSSIDKTGNILERFASRGLIKVIHTEKNIGKKRALARAMLLAKGEIFVFSDSDTVLARDGVGKVVDVFRADEEVGAVSGHSRALNAEANLLTRIQDTWYEGQFSVRKAFETVFGAVQCVSGPLAAFRKEAVYNFIPAWINDTFLGREFKFATDRTMTAFVLGSATLGASIKKRYADSPFVKEVDYPLRSWKVVYTKYARAWTKVPDTIPRFLKQQIRWKKSFIRNMFFTGRFYWRRPFPVALMYYLHILFVVVGPFIVFRHLIWLPLQGNIFSGILYLSGILFIGLLFAFAHWMEERGTDQWIYRPLMNIISTFFLSWLIFYSAATITNMTWSRK